MQRDYYTTTEAAKLLSVSPDTVLKWVRAGKISSYLTPGGHARIPKEAVAQLLPNGHRINATPQNQDKVRGHKFRYCWDYYAGRGQLKGDCLKCGTYLNRENRCYEVRQNKTRFAELPLNCNIKCEDCEIHKLTEDNEVYVLLVSPSESLKEIISEEENQSAIALKVVSSEYECAAAIDKFRPDFIIIDSAMGAPTSKELCLSLMNDKRIPFKRIIICSRKSNVDDYCDSEIFGWIRKPFTMSQLDDFIGGVAQA